MLIPQLSRTSSQVSRRGFCTRHRCAASDTPRLLDRTQQQSRRLAPLIVTDTLGPTENLNPRAVTSTWQPMTRDCSRIADSIGSAVMAKSTSTLSKTRNAIDR